MSKFLTSELVGASGALLRMSLDSLSIVSLETMQIEWVVMLFIIWNYTCVEEIVLAFSFRPTWLAQNKGLVGSGRCNFHFSEYGTSTHLVWIRSRGNGAHGWMLKLPMQWCCTFHIVCLPFFYKRLNTVMIKKDYLLWK